MNYTSGTVSLLTHVEMENGNPKEKILEEDLCGSEEDYTAAIMRSIKSFSDNSESTLTHKM